LRGFRFFDLSIAIVAATLFEVFPLAFGSCLTASVAVVATAFATIGIDLFGAYGAHLIALNAPTDTIPHLR